MLLRSLDIAKAGRLRLSRRVKKMEISQSDPGLNCRFIRAIQPGYAVDSTHIMFSEVFSIFCMQHWGYGKSPDSISTISDIDDDIDPVFFFRSEMLCTDQPRRRGFFPWYSSASDSVVLQSAEKRPDRMPYIVMQQFR